MARPRWPSFLGLLLAVGAGAAQADERIPFGERHQLVLSALNLVRYSHAEQRVNLGGISGATHMETDAFGLTSAPDVAIDWLVAHRLSVGLGLSISRSSTSAPYYILGPGGTTVTRYEDRSFALAVAPRVGLVVAPKPRLSLWPQLGVFYTRVSDRFVGTLLTVDYGASFAVPVLFEVAPQVFAGLTPATSVSLGGSKASASYSFDPRPPSYSLSAGMGLYF